MCAYALSIIARRALAEMQALWLLRRDELDGGRVPTKPPLQRGGERAPAGATAQGPPAARIKRSPYKRRANRAKT